MTRGVITPECASHVICSWVRRIQDAAPPDLCRDHPAWRAALPLLAGTRDGSDSERAGLLLDWMWVALGDEAVITTIPVSARVAWDLMLSVRTASAAESAAHAAAAARAAVDAARAHYPAARAYWVRRDLPGTLRRLCEVGQ